MPYITYQPKKFSAEHAAIIAKAEEICGEYKRQGFKLTLRQLYYQFVARALLPNNMQSYKRLGSIVNDARLAGELDWASIEDRTRNLVKRPTWDSPREIIAACAEQFRLNPWETQTTRIEVWIEKEALVGVIEPVCNRNRVPFFACRGYTSQSEAWEAGQRFNEYGANDQSVVILHLGDHDPSGIDMTRDNDARLTMFADLANVTVRRLALNEEQVAQYKPPPNPAKLTDSRATGYIERFGYQSWELDALEPKVIAALIHDNIQEFVDEDAWAEAMDKEEAMKARLSETAEKWVD